MIRVFHVPHFRSVRVIWLMEELGEPYQVEVAPDPLTSEFRSRTGVLAIPTIVDGDIVMGESIAILQYLTGRRLQRSLELGLTVGPNPHPERYAEHLQWLHFGEASLMFRAAVLLRLRPLAEAGRAAVAAAKAGEAALQTRLDALERQLVDGRPYLTGEAFTIADISVGYALGYMRFRGLDGLLGPRARAYLALATARPAYMKADAD
jgi:glutathione S-transferase